MFYGDVAPSLLTLGTPDKVYEYAIRLVKEFAPQGLIMSSGCSIPPNVKVKNVKAMVEGCT